MTVSLMVNRLKVRTKVSVENLRVKPSPKIFVGRRFDMTSTRLPLFMTTGHFSVLFDWPWRWGRRRLREQGREPGLIEEHLLVRRLPESTDLLFEDRFMRALLSA